MIDTKQSTILLKRNVGIDLLKIVLMIMIVILHILGRGGVLASCQYLSASYEVAWFLEIASYGAVNCFALITGYLCINARNSLAKLLDLWFEIFFYGVVIFLGFYIIWPDSIHLNAIYQLVLPISTSKYWYLTAYFGMFILIPILNAGLKSLDSKSAVKILLLCFILFSLPSKIVEDQAYGLSAGYSTIWLCIVYLFGAFYRLNEDKITVSAVNSFLFYIAQIFITFVFKFAIEHWFPGVQGQYINARSLVGYTSPTIFLGSLALLNTFARLKVRNEKISSAISNVGALTLSVYIIHVHPLVFHGLFRDGFVALCELPALQLAFAVLFCAIMIFGACIVVDTLRVRLFKTLKIKKLCRKLETGIDRLIDRYIFHVANNC